jgi:hypothetical protein
MPIDRTNWTKLKIDVDNHEDCKKYYEILALIVKRRISCGKITDGYIIRGWGNWESYSRSKILENSISSVVSAKLSGGYEYSHYSPLWIEDEDDLVMILLLISNSTINFKIDNKGNWV